MSGEGLSDAPNSGIDMALCIAAVKSDSPQPSEKGLNLILSVIRKLNIEKV